MKTLITALTLTLSVSAMANSMTCIEVDSNNQVKRNAAVIQITEAGKEIAPRNEDEQSFDRIMPQTISVEKGERKLGFSYLKATSFEADVHFEMKSQDGKVEFFTFLDELEESTLHVNGKRFHFNCFY